MRITIKQLEALVDHLNDLTDSPKEPWTKVNGKFKANIGNFHLSGAYGGYALHRTVSDGGGVEDLFGGHIPKRELFDLIHAYIKGIETK